MTFGSKEDIYRYIREKIGTLVPIQKAFVTDSGKSIGICFNPDPNVTCVWKVGTSHAKSLKAAHKVSLLRAALGFDRPEVDITSIPISDPARDLGIHMATTNAIVDLCLNDSEVKRLSRELFQEVAEEFGRAYRTKDHERVVREHQKQLAMVGFSTAAQRAIEVGIEYDSLRDNLDKLLVKYVDGA